MRPFEPTFSWLRSRVTERRGSKRRKIFCFMESLFCRFGPGGKPPGPRVASGPPPSEKHSSKNLVTLRRKDVMSPHPGVWEGSRLYFDYEKYSLKLPSSIYPLTITRSLRVAEINLRGFQTLVAQPILDIEQIDSTSEPTSRSRFTEPMEVMLFADRPILAGDL